jgi:hypothetical protein
MNDYSASIPPWRVELTQQRERIIELEGRLASYERLAAKAFAAIAAADAADAAAAAFAFAYWVERYEALLEQG